MTLARRFAILLLVIMIAGCGEDVRSQVFTSTNKDQITENIGKSKLSDEDRALVIGALVRSAFGYSLTGKTVGQVIDDQRTYVTEEEARQKATREAQEKEKARVAAVMGQMRSAITVTPLSKRYQQTDYQKNGNFDSGVVIKWQYKNVGNKDVKAFKGEAVFANQLGDHISTLNVAHDEPTLNKGQSQTEELIYRFTNNRFENTSLPSMKFTWQPQVILFQNGDKLTAEAAAD